MRKPGCQIGIVKLELMDPLVDSVTAFKELE